MGTLISRKYISDNYDLRNNGELSTNDSLIANKEWIEKNYWCEDTDSSNPEHCPDVSQLSKIKH